jgi:hypothetical protein
MPEYRFYTLGKDSRVVGAPMVLKCQDDQAAVDKAKQFLDGRVIEIWNLTRLVTRLDPRASNPFFMKNLRRSTKTTRRKAADALFRGGRYLSTPKIRHETTH